MWHVLLHKVKTLDDAWSDFPVSALFRGESLPKIWTCKLATLNEFAWKMWILNPERGVNRMDFESTFLNKSTWNV